MVFSNICSNIGLISNIRPPLDAESRELSNDTIFCIITSVIDSE